MERPKVGIGVFVINGDKILMGKRVNAHGEGTWGLPGGHLEFFETFEECAKREVVEETGLVITNVEFSTVTNDMFYPENRHYVTLFMKSLYLSGTPKVMEPNKMVEWRWFSWDNLPKPLFIPLENLKRTTYNPFNIE